jgi:hypothetical protein
VFAAATAGYGIAQLPYQAAEAFIELAAEQVAAMETASRQQES